MFACDFHVHLHGCLGPKDLWELGKDSHQSQTGMLDWFALEYEKAWGRRPDYKAYWESASGFELLKNDFLFDKPNSFNRFQANFNLIIALCAITPDSFAIQEQIIRKVNSHGLSYFEARTVIPFRFDANQAYDYLKGLCQTVVRLNSELDLKTKLVFSLFRSNDLAKTHYEWLRLFMDKHPSLSEVISGIDFAYTEEGFPPKTKNDLFQRFVHDNLTSRKLDLLYHVGESFEDKGIVSAIRWIVQAQGLGADRLGHALALGVDPENYRGRVVEEAASEYLDTLRWLIDSREELQSHGYTVDVAGCKNELSSFHSAGQAKLITYDDAYIADVKSLQRAVAGVLKAKNAVIECCPTSNLLIGQISSPAYHPLRFFAREKLTLLFGTDDPGVFDTDWRKEFELAQTLGR